MNFRNDAMENEMMEMESDRLYNQKNVSHLKIGIVACRVLKRSLDIEAQQATRSAGSRIRRPLDINQHVNQKAGLAKISEIKTRNRMQQFARKFGVKHNIVDLSSDIQVR